MCETKPQTAATLVCSFARVLLTCPDLCCDWPKNNKHSRPRLFKRWIALSTGKITIQWMSIRKTNCTIHWIEIYLLDSAFHLFNNRALKYLHGFQSLTAKVLSFFNKIYKFSSTCRQHFIFLPFESLMF